MKTFFARTIGWIVLLLIGPAPATSLFLAAAEPACQMACCKRAGHDLCDRHSGGPAFEARTTCPSGCCQSSVAPSRTDAATSSARLSISSYLAAASAINLPSIPTIPSVTDPFLYQRPPPTHSA